MDESDDDRDELPPTPSPDNKENAEVVSSPTDNMTDEQVLFCC